MNTDRDNASDLNGADDEQLFDCLAKARVEKGLSTEAIAEHLKITEAYVIALEKGQFDLLPAHAFARGYLKNYAKLVGLDPIQLASRFDSYTRSNGEEKTTFTDLLSSPRRSLPVFRYLATVVSLAVVVAGSYVLWNGSHQKQELSVVDGSTGLESVEQPKVSPAPESESINPVPMEANADQPELEMAEVPPPVMDEQPDDVSEVISKDDDVAEPVPVVSGEQLSVPADMATLFIRFREDCWMEVKDMSGKVLITGLKKAGTELNIEVPSTIRLRLGNGPGVAEVRFGGHAVDIPANGVGKKLAKLTLNAFGQG